MTQAEIDDIVKSRLDRDREVREAALAKDLGMPLKDVKALIRSQKEAEEAKKSEIEKLTGERDTHKSDAQLARIEAAKVRALARAGADPEKIDALLKRVVGNTPEEIEADVKELKELGLLGGKPAHQKADGAGNPGLQTPPAGPTIDDQIAAAVKAGNMQLLAHLKLKKQSELFK